MYIGINIHKLYLTISKFYSPGHDFKPRARLEPEKNETFLIRIRVESVSRSFFLKAYTGRLSEIYRVNHTSGIYIEREV